MLIKKGTYLFSVMFSKKRRFGTRNNYERFLESMHERIKRLRDYTYTPKTFKISSLLKKEVNKDKVERYEETISPPKGETHFRVYDYQPIIDILENGHSVRFDIHRGGEVETIIFVKLIEIKKVGARYFVDSEGKMRDPIEIECYGYSNIEKI